MPSGWSPNHPKKSCSRLVGAHACRTSAVRYGTVLRAITTRERTPRALPSILAATGVTAERVTRAGPHGCARDLQPQVSARGVRSWVGAIARGHYRSQIVSTTFPAAVHMQLRHQLMFIGTAYLAHVVEAQQVQHHHFWVFNNGVMLESWARIATPTPSVCG